MPMYIDVITAASETVTKILVQRGAYQEQQIEVNTAGGRTAGVVWRKDQVRLSLPTLPADAILTRAEADQIVGYIAHECCHVLHSTWIEWQFAVQAGPRVQR